MAAENELRRLVASVAGRRTGPVGRSLHLHQLDEGRLEAMIHLDSGGARVEWEHGKGDCAITGDGQAILDLLRGDATAADLAASGRLTLYGDVELVDLAPTLFGEGSAGR